MGSIVKTETALFVTESKAQQMRYLALAKKDVKCATYAKRYSRGCLQGYWIKLKMRDGTITAMSESYATSLSLAQPIDYPAS